MMMGVPLFGWAQMPMSWLFEQGFLRSVLGMEEAGSVQGGQTLSLASFSAVNRLLKNLTLSIVSTARRTSSRGLR